MTAADVAIVALMTLSSLLTVAMIGKPRDPIAPRVAVLTLLINGSLIVWLLASHGVLR